jgi:hypothetical protein
LGLSLKSLLPIAGAAAGFFLGPAGNAAVTAALGSGIGTLLAGGDIKDAVKNAALAGAAGTGLGAGTSAAAQQALKAQQAVAAAGTSVGAAASPAGRSALAAEGIGKLLTPGNLLMGSLALGALEEPEQVELTELQKEQIRTGERDPYYQGRNLINIPQYAMGGYIEGPGTGRSDSIESKIYQNGVPVQEARLSDGEFVFTERAVRGLGNGDRSKGAAKMYEMMRQYERMA